MTKWRAFRFLALSTGSLAFCQLLTSPQVGWFFTRQVPWMLKGGGMHISLGVTFGKIWHNPLMLLNIVDIIVQ